MRFFIWRNWFINWTNHMNCQDTLQIGSETILYWTKEISYFLISEIRKNLRITVTPEMSVFVKAPIEFSSEMIKEKILKKWAWIMKQLEYFSAFHPKKTKRLYKSWETHLYLGREYILDIKVSDERSSIKIKGRNIEVTTNKVENVEKMMDKWYQENAKNKIESIFWKISAGFQKNWLTPSGFKLRKMGNRWGSCSNKGIITLNSLLIQAPKACIEYVIVHEHCHLIHFDHTKKFYEFQTKEMKDWQKWKEKLERLLA